MRAATPLILLLLAILASGCATSVKVQDEFPVPLVEQLPLTVGLVLNEELSNYQHVEDPMMDAEWSIDIGKANVDMFTALFSGMFRETLLLELDENGIPLVPDSPELDAIIEPRLEDFEFSVPRQSGNDQYTVWIRYQLLITKPDDEEVGNWRITAYGQVDQGAMGMGEADAMQEAAVLALRDAGANIATSFSKAPGVKSKLLEPNNEMFQEQNFATP